MVKNHPFRKKWGQNFLRDPNTIEKIVKLINPQKHDTILEIGPGDGALTDKISNYVGSLYVVEIDPLLIKHLKEKKYNNVKICSDDILNWNFSILPEKFKVIGNLPYNISSPILFRFITNMIFKEMVLMFQKELADRIVSTEGSKSYGRISVMCQTYFDVERKFNVSRNVFQPKPGVDSSVLSFHPKKSIIPDPLHFSQFIKKVFSNRRKKLKNNLGEEYKDDVINKFLDFRPDAISPMEYIEIYRRIYIG